MFLAYQTINEVYKTKPATTTVMMRPGTNPRTEYEYGNDIMAKQIYSAKSSAAVCEPLLEAVTKKRNVIAYVRKKRTAHIYQICYVLPQWIKKMLSKPFAMNRSDT